MLPYALAVLLALVTFGFGVIVGRLIEQDERRK